MASSRNGPVKKLTDKRKRFILRQVYGTYTPAMDRIRKARLQGAAAVIPDERDKITKPKLVKRDPLPRAAVASSPAWGKWKHLRGA